MKDSRIAEWLSKLRHRLKALLWRRRLQHDLEEELQFHVDMHARKNIAQGLPAGDAHWAAQRSFGNISSFKEICRDMWTLGSIEILWQDIRYAFRMLKRSLSFTTVAVIALALGIGANTAIFSVVNAVILRPLPYPDPGKLVILWGNVHRAKVERRGASYPDFADWRAQSKSFEDMAAVSDGAITITGVDEPERVPFEYVSASYFSILGVSAVQGRVFLSSEDQVPDRNAVVILTENLWKRRFGGDAGIIGKTIQLNNRGYTVVGVMLPSFRGLTDSAQLWLPFMMSGASDLSERGSRGMQVLARYKPGVARAAAQAELDAISKRLEREYPDTNQARGVEIAPLDAEVFGEIRVALLVLLGAVGFVLLIACANVANLLLARSEARQREIAIRAALGAGRIRLWRQLLTESCVLALIGAAAGLLIARFGVRALMAASPVTFPSFVHAEVDLSVAAVTLAASLVCGLFMGLAPAAHARITRLHAALRESSGRSSGGKLSKRFRDALVVAEVSLTLVLLIGAGLLIRSFREITALNPGFDPEHLLALRVSLPRLPASAANPTLTGNKDAKTVTSTRQVLERVRAIPSVHSVSASSDLPLDGNARAIIYTAEGQPPVTAQTMPRAYLHFVTPEFFETLRTRFVTGRSFSESEMTADDVVVVSEGVAKRFWPGQDPINKRVKGGQPDSKNPWMRIIGVVAEMKYRGLPNNPTGDPDIFIPLTERQRTFSLLVRTSLDPASLPATVRAAVQEVDRTAAMFGISTMNELMGQQTARSRFTSWLMAIFASVALLLAMVGVYGVMSYAVTRRTQEIGIRMALGAGRADVLGMVVRQGMLVILIGIAVGVVAALGLTRLMTTLLYGVTPTDLFTFSAVPAVLIVVALFACWLPALRASRVDPLIALRYE